MRSGINACMSAISYAAAIRPCTAKFLTTKRPPGCALNERVSFDRFCLMDATSKVRRGSEAWVCARSAIGLDTPTANPATTTTTDDRKRTSSRFIELAPGQHSLSLFQITLQCKVIGQPLVQFARREKSCNPRARITRVGCHSAPADSRERSAQAPHTDKRDRPHASRAVTRAFHG